jgi:hypothetical protein
MARHAHRIIRREKQRHRHAIIGLRYPADLPMVHDSITAHPARMPGPAPQIVRNLHALHSMQVV